MKKKYTLLAIGILCLHCLSIEARTVLEASAIASSFVQLRSESIPANRIRQASHATTVSVPVELAYTQLQVDSITPAVYIFNSEHQGFVLVAAEDNTRTILGYSDEGYFDENNIPDNMLFWLQMYADEMARETTNNQATRLVAAQHDSTRLEVIKRKQSVDTYPTINPILGETIWGQGTPFNNSCPTYDGQYTATGCVATALSQIMYTHKHPTKGKGSYSYTTTTKQLNVGADFGNTTYDWENMIPNYSSSYTTTQANAVSTLMYHVGVAANMDYTVEASGTRSILALMAITNYFDYDKAINVLLKDFMKEENILQAIALDLQAGLPVYVSGYTINQEGHAFVCDGMKSDGYLHINWGWNGTANGYFTLSALSPEHQGTGGSTSDLAFTEGIEVYTNIKPNAGGEASPLVIVDKLTLTSDDEISKDEEVSFSLERFYSAGIARAEGMVTYFIYDSNGELACQVPIGTFELPSGFHYTAPIHLSESLPDSLAAGNYELEIRYVVDTTDIDYPILAKELGEVRIPFTVTNTQFIFSTTSVDYSIKNLQVTTSQDTVFFSYESEAPNFHIKITKEEGDVIAEGIIDLKNVLVTELEDGHYTLWIRPIDAAQEYYIGDAAEATFTISTKTTNVVDITSDKILYLYDIMGRPVDSKPAYDKLPFHVPQSGVYILQGQKVFISR